eukprot:TRINITY_DN8745_c0_g1_i1.p1 TRINITY_DN8745_c0_g1~~TRINITY_DN8745_c0_g1_i1.p1  ORF type:complete len:311 (+),score=47.86 TRINITY_DN8745_c0_g1_i1:69-1001(+)
MSAYPGPPLSPLYYKDPPSPMRVARSTPGKSGATYDRERNVEYAFGGMPASANKRSVKNVGDTEIVDLEKRKKQAVLMEDFVEAHRLKLRLDALRGAPPSPSLSYTTSPPVSAPVLPSPSVNPAPPILPTTPLTTLAASPVLASQQQITPRGMDRALTESAVCVRFSLCTRPNEPEVKVCNNTIVMRSNSGTHAIYIQEQGTAHWEAYNCSDSEWVSVGTSQSRAFSMASADIADPGMCISVGFRAVPSLDLEFVSQQWLTLFYEFLCKITATPPRPVHELQQLARQAFRRPAAPLPLSPDDPAWGTGRQ